ncbi:MAG: hypothetical protein HKN48_01265 [Flavobacteriaceae bacterium]|nr:hypothetical protein [Flavobacteriaceae bacterium]
MLLKTNIEDRLIKLRDKRISSETILKEVQEILEKNENERDDIKARLSDSSEENVNEFNLDKVKGENIFHIEDIKKLCIDYRLRFLNANFFKGDFPEEAISEIRNLESEHGISLQNFKIVAPAKLLKLENADDPLLFAPMGNDYYYLIHKWGNDLHPFRKALMWPYKTFENLVFSVFVLSVILTAITPLHLFTKGEVTNQEYLLMFLFMFKAVGGIVLYYGFAKGKNFNTAIWNSKYYNA